MWWFLIIFLKNSFFNILVIDYFFFRRLHDVPAQCGRGELRAERFAQRHHAAKYEQLLVGDSAAVIRAAQYQPE